MSTEAIYKASQALSKAVRRRNWKTAGVGGLTAIPLAMMAAPAVAWALVYRQTNDVAFAFWMATIPASWAGIHICGLYDAAIRKRFYACKSRFLTHMANAAAQLVGHRATMKEWASLLRESSNTAKLAADRIS